MVNQEALINIETNTYYTYTSTKDSITVGATTYNYLYGFHGADNGAAISIINSNFEHSKFCKGLLVYRPTV